MGNRHSHHHLVTSSPHQPPGEAIQRRARNVRGKAPRRAADGVEETSLNKRPANLQDGFLNQLRRQRIPITLFLSSGVQLRGNLAGFDSFVMILESPGKPTQLVYKHSIVSVAPAWAPAPPPPREPAPEGAPAAAGAAGEAPAEEADDAADAAAMEVGHEEEGGPDEAPPPE
jgi:host factor-I protein